MISTTHPRSSRPGRPLPRRAVELAHLSLDELRDYRGQLVTEETRVSYWRRILQARLDLVLDTGDHRAMARLRNVLNEHASSSHRLALLPLQAADDSPPLPDLAALWQTPVDQDADDDLVARLTHAEIALSTYRTSLHQRLDAATGELISRYRDEPGLALAALPQRQHRRSA